MKKTPQKTPRASKGSAPHKTGATKRTTSSLPARLASRAARSQWFRRGYMLLSLLVLFGTTLLWAVLGAHVQQQNADQLSDPYLFSNWQTFHAGFFPASHTFLLKWPVFWLLRLVGVTPRNLLIATVGVVLATVATLALVLYKIDRRPLVFGTICLGLSLALLLVPAQPYAQGLLPVNMAMLTTRNLEYAVYLVALALFAKARNMRNWRFVVGVALLAVLIASDKLFMSLSLGGAVLALAVYAALRAWNLVNFAVRWLIGTVLGTLGGLAILETISATRLTHLVGGNTASPYSAVHSAQNAVLGVVYAVLGLLTNAGANPAYDNLVIRKLPGELLHRLWSIWGIAYVVAGVGLVYALVLAWRQLWRRPRLQPHVSVPAANLLALALSWSTVAALGVFVLAQHDYTVDARYLGVALFALVVTVSVELRTRVWRWSEDLLIVGCNLLIAISIAVFAAVHISSTQTTALRPLASRNDVIAAALQHHKVKALVGDYWRVLPIKLQLKNDITTMPLGTCTQPNGVLTSSAWKPDLHKTSFAYLLTITGSVTDFPGCSITQVTAAYGQPNATQVIAGTLAHPAEVLLFYDQGSHPKLPATERASTASVLPITPDLLTGTGCMGTTIMNVVAHQDDDLLFMSPDLLHEVRGGDCIRTVYLTAGNAGLGRLYWLGRQQGAEAAYDAMLGGKKNVWVQSTVQLSSHEYVTVVSPRNHPRISLVFCNLPDGDPQGQGFPMSNFQSLAKLQSGAISSMRTVDGQSSYSSAQLTNALTRLMLLYRPSEIHTQADVQSDQYPDHSDHIAAGQFTAAAAAAYDQKASTTTPLHRYIGYPIHGYDPNVSGDDLVQKQTAFFAYARFDEGTCTSVLACQNTVYSQYLSRQYQE